jgi:2-dehydropantoate 2-reductase
MTMINNILVAGAGALGMLYGHRFIGKKNIYFLANGSRKFNLEKKGIKVNNISYTVKCAEEKSFKPDFILVAVKHNGLKQVVKELNPFISKNTIIMSVMNGIDSEKYIKQNTNAKKLLISVALGMDAVRIDNSTNYSVEGKIVFNKFDSNVTDTDIKDICNLFDECKIAYEVIEDIKHALWYKFMINTGVNQVSAVLNANYGFLRTNKYARKLMENIMIEVIEIANAEGIKLTSKDIDNFYTVLNTLGAEGKTSMCQDIEAAKNTEVDMFSGKMIELGKKHSIDVTINKIMYNLIKSKEYINKQGLKK